MAMTAASMAGHIKARIAAVAASQGSDAAVARAYRDAVMDAMCQGIIDEILANSELVAVTQDSGAAGAGIITGKVK